MRLITGLIGVLSLAAGAARAVDYPFAPPGWAIEARLAAAPDTDTVLTPSPQGDVRATRFFLEKSGERTFLVRFTYPMALRPGGEEGVYAQAVAEMLKSRPGEVRQREKYVLGPYVGERLVIAQRRDKTIREVRLLVIGASLYLLTAEWPEAGTGATRAAGFFHSIQLRPEWAEILPVQERERWRELAAGSFKLRYDASRWYRDPADQEPGVFNLLRLDQHAEAQFIAEDRPVEGADIETAVLNTAREGAESVSVRKRGAKLRGSVQLTELEFTARVDSVTYCNHGYFYSGPEGTVQLRGWAREMDYRDMIGDIAELLDGLVITSHP